MRPFGPTPAAGTMTPPPSARCRASTTPPPPPLDVHQRWQRRPTHLRSVPAPGGKAGAIRGRGDDPLLSGRPRTGVGPRVPIRPRQRRRPERLGADAALPEKAHISIGSGDREARPTRAVDDWPSGMLHSVRKASSGGLVQVGERTISSSLSSPAWSLGSFSLFRFSVRRPSAYSSAAVYSTCPRISGSHSELCRLHCWVS